MCSSREYDKPSVYQIRVKGNLDRKWTDWFDGFKIERIGDDVTLLTGSVPDQAALHGILNKIRDLGLPLLSMSRCEPVEKNDEIQNGDGNISNGGLT